jgi:hypothetical protein
MKHHYRPRLDIRVSPLPGNIFMFRRENRAGNSWGRKELKSALGLRFPFGQSKALASS